MVRGFMVRVFDRNMFIMLLSIMVGVIIITYFYADIQNRMRTEKLISKHTTEIKIIESKNINFTNGFIQSLGLLDLAREYRADGNYNFDLAMMWYRSALSELNADKLNDYRSKTINDCDSAIVNYTFSYDNFIEAKNRFNFTKGFVNYDVYLSILDLYVNLAESGSKLVSLRINASNYLKNIAENLTITNNTVSYMTNISGLLELFNKTILRYHAEEDIYSDIEDQIEKEYDIIGFSEIREEG